MGKRPRNRKPNPGPAAGPKAKPMAGAGPSTMTMEPPSEPESPRTYAAGPLFHPHAVGAVFARNYLAYFSNPAGYVFIVLFVVVSAIVAFWRPIFFANNLASLGTLDEWMPYILMIFIPAITMNAWAEERRLGTDELLLTLPARDAEVALGKFLAALGIYTTALAFSLSLVAILYWLGSPDLGVVAATYLGYWLMGVLLIAIGLVASVLSSNVTVAFILGVVFSAVPVFAGLFGAPFGVEYRRVIEDLSVPSQFRDFGTGVVPLVGLVYFVGLAAAMLYLNMVLLGRRHWAGGERSRGLWLHMLARVVAVVVALAAAEVLVARWLPARWDLSSEGLHKLSPESLRLVRDIPSARPVYVEAYYSEDVPRDLVQTKMDLLSKLREFAAASKGRILLNLVPTQLYSDEARQAEKQYGITPRQVRDSDEARQGVEEVFLGVAFTSGAEEVVVPFFDPGLPVEYELARSIRVVAKAQRKKLGVLQTDAKLLGGFDFRAMGQNQEWPIVSELKKQYEVSSVAADAPIPGDLDVLLVAQPGSLTQRQIENLTGHVRAGKATLLFVDPFPAVDPQLSPELPRPQPGGMFGGGGPVEPKGSLDPLLDLLGVDWPQSEIVWNEYNPYPQFRDIPPEVVFIGKGGGGPKAFNPDEPATSGLQVLVMPYPGQIRAKSGGGAFTPLLQTGDEGGTVAWSDLVRQGPFGMSGINPRPRRQWSRLGSTLAARIQGKPSAPPRSDDPAKKDEKPAEASALNAIVVADLDLISETFFRLRAQKIEGLDFDNVTFVLNCVDVLAGDKDYVELRKRRPLHRTLTRLEENTKSYIERAQKETKDAEEAASTQLAEAQKRLDAKVDALRKQTDTDAQTKSVQLERLQEVESLRLAVERTNIEDAKRRKIADSKAVMETEVRKIQTKVRAAAVLLPPLPALLLGAVVLAVRLGRENRGANPNRLA